MNLSNNLGHIKWTSNHSMERGKWDFYEDNGEIYIRYTSKHHLKKFNRKFVSWDDFIYEYDRISKIGYKMMHYVHKSVQKKIDMHITAMRI